MAKRMILMLLAVALLLGTIGFVKYRQIQAAIAQGMAYRPPPEAVTTIVAKQDRWEDGLRAIGSAEAARGVTVSADLPGMVRKITFDSGRKVGAGDVLVELDTEQERSQLAAAEAQRDLARLNLERMTGLRPKGVVSQAEYDRAAAESKQADARAGEIRAMIERKTIRAPFAGTLGIRQVNLGQYLTGGAPIVPLQAIHPIYVNFSVPQQVVSGLKVGDEVTATVSGASGGDVRGKISAIDSVIDVATRNIQVQATFDNQSDELRPGMFLEVSVASGSGTDVVALPTSAISYAPYGDSVFIVEDLKGPDGTTYRGVRQQFVKLGSGRGDQIAILTGVKPGQEIVTSGVFKLRNGAAVVINNEIQPPNNPAPKPEDS